MVTKVNFGLIENIGFGIEDIFFCFFLGGISATLWEFVFNKREITIKHKINNHHVLAIGGVIVNLVLLFEIFLPNYTIFYSCFLMIILVYFGAYKYRKDLLKYITESGIVFMVYYLIILKAIFHPVNYFERFYHDNFLTKINLFGMPIEEFLFGFAFGTLGAFLYKFLYDKKVVNTKG